MVPVRRVSGDWINRINGMHVWTTRAIASQACRRGRQQPVDPVAQEVPDGLIAQLDNKHLLLMPLDVRNAIMLGEV